MCFVTPGSDDCEKQGSRLLVHLEWFRGSDPRAAWLGWDCPPKLPWPRPAVLPSSASPWQIFSNTQGQADFLRPPLSSCSNPCISITAHYTYTHIHAHTHTLGCWNPPLSEYSIPNPESLPRVALQLFCSVHTNLLAINDGTGFSTRQLLSTGLGVYGLPEIVCKQC